MEMIKIPKEEYNKMVRQIKLLKEVEKIDIDLVRQFKNSLEDAKIGKISRVA
tara:strand:+ start:799 stop:954 length:156 start_codon:yes stop_codon:yes gene_type:complete